MSRLTGKVALITGAGGAIGSAAAARFVAEGAKVFLVDRDKGAVEALAGKLGSQALAFSADVSDADQVAGYVRAAVQRFGGVEIFLNNAGIEGVVGPRIDASPIDAFD